MSDGAKKASISSTVVVVAVQDHAALRRAGRPRRVDQREEVVVADLLPSPIDRVGVFLGVLAAQRSELVEALGLEDVRELDPFDLLA